MRRPILRALSLLPLAACAPRGGRVADTPLAASAASAASAALPAWYDSLPGPGEPARRFAPGVVSTGDVFASAFSPDLRTVVTSKVSPRGALRGIALVAYHWRAGRWAGPDTLPFSGPDPLREMDPAFSADGRRLYFSSNRAGGIAPGDTGMVMDTWYADRAGDGWAAPVHVPAPVNGPALDMYPSVAHDGTLYFDSFRDGPRQAYRARQAGGGAGWAAPERLPPAINGDSGASNLYVDPDERVAVFIGRSAESYGAADLHVSLRTADGWTPARNLGPLVNTAATEFCPWVTPDGRYLFFTRVTPLGGGAFERNVYVVRFDHLLAGLGR